MERVKMKNRRGAILILVLGMLMLMSLIVSLFLSDVMRDSFMKIQLEGKDALRHEAYNVLEFVKCQIQQDLSKNNVLENYSISLDNAKLGLPESVSVSINISDESGKIPLNDLNQKMLKSLFSLFVDIWDAQKLMQDYWQWCNQKPIASQMIESESYGINKVVKKKSNTPQSKTDSKDSTDDKQEKEDVTSKPHFSYALVSYDQLKDIDSFRVIFFDEQGDGNEKLKRLKNCTTLFGNYPININSASKDVLEVMSKNFSLDLDLMEHHLGLSENSKETPKYYKDLKEINTLGHGNLILDKKEVKDGKNRLDAKKFLGTDLRMLRLNILVQEADVSFLLGAVLAVRVTRDTKSKKRLVVLEQKAIRENNF